MTVTPVAGQNSVITTGGTAVQVIPALPNGGIVTNPYAATEALYIDPVASATLTASGTTFALQPGQSWTVIPGQSTPTTANAASNGHAFTVVYW